MRHLFHRLGLFVVILINPPSQGAEYEPFKEDPSHFDGILEPDLQKAYDEISKSFQQDFKKIATRFSTWRSFIMNIRSQKIAMGPKDKNRYFHQFNSAFNMANIHLFHLQYIIIQNIPTCQSKSCIQSLETLYETLWKFRKGILRPSGDFFKIKNKLLRKLLTDTELETRNRNIAWDQVQVTEQYMIQLFVEYFDGDLTSENIWEKLFYKYKEYSIYGFEIKYKPIKSEYVRFQKKELALKLRD